jgi:hypothetical protein
MYPPLGKIKVKLLLFQSSLVLSILFLNWGIFFRIGDNSQLSINKTPIIPQVNDAKQPFFVDYDARLSRIGESNSVDDISEF